MSAKRSSRISDMDDRPAAVGAYSCALELPSGAFSVRVPLEQSFGTRSCVRVSMHPPQEPISSVMDWPPRCCVTAPRWARSASCWVIAVLRLRRSTPRLTSMRCAHSRCRGREVCDEHAPTSCSGVPDHAAQLGIQAAECRYRIARLRLVHGASPRLLHHACLLYTSP